MEREPSEDEGVSSKPLRLIPPPLVYVAAFALGLLIEKWAPSSGLLVSSGGRPATALRLLAGLSIAVGIALGPLNAVRFLLRGTTLNPNAPATLFLTEGIYGLSRNPMYLGLFFIYFGVAVVTAKLWPFATMIIPILVMDRVVVPFEEGQMVQRFGAAYLEYCSRVRRWFPLGTPKSPVASDLLGSKD